ncbi:type II toxin-antitoxin system YhaV family toxin, partial [Escherichia coli]|uniref:type II toxin-antitoxin system YhaV family toxin n=1 Tax=Escherichia coli TaxID=562 RepID=UPI0021A35099
CNPAYSKSIHTWLRFGEIMRGSLSAGRYRFFFRYSEKEKVIILGWMNDENTLRTYGKKTDAYTVFSKMLKRGHPPADWESLTQETEENH